MSANHELLLFSGGFTHERQDRCIKRKKMNFDGNLDFSVLSSDVTVYDDTTPEQLLERIEGAAIIVTRRCR